jgi:hypothetical protein
MESYVVRRNGEPVPQPHVPTSGLAASAPRQS